MANFRPTTHYILSIQRQALPWWKALAELIDNGFDAKANRVVVNIKGRTVTVSDNGKGIPDIVKAVTLGGHVEAYGQGLGMYGVGLKDAWLSAGDRIDIATIRDGIKTELSIDIRNLNDDWEGPDPTSETTDDENGTSIMLHLREKRNTPDSKVFDKLGFIFSPAIQQGLQVVYGTHGRFRPLRAAQLPPFSDSIQASFDVDGKSVFLNVGILQEGARMTDGPFCFAHKHRIIDASSLGAKGMSCLAVGGLITLGDGWKFTKNKDAIAENADHLEDAIFARISPLLDKASQQAMNIHSDQIRTELETMMNESLNELKKEARDSTRESSGTVSPISSGKQRRRASKTHDESGNVTDVSKARRNGLKIDWCKIGDDEIGRYDSRTNTVNLNMEIPIVSFAKETSNMPALYAVALAIFSDWLCTHKDGQRTMFEVADFGSTLGRLLKVKTFHDDNVRKTSGGGSVSYDDRGAVHSTEG